MEDNPIDKVLSTDPYALTESLGLKPEEDFGLFLGMFSGINAQKRRILELNDDTYMGISYEKFHQLVTQYGFNIKFKKRFGERRDIEYIYADNNGIIIHLTTFGGGTSINGGHLHVCCVPRDNESFFKIIAQSSGGYSKAEDGNEYMMMSFDIREGLMNKIRTIRTNSRVVKTWPKLGHYTMFYLLDYEEEKHLLEPDYKWKQIQDDKIRSHEDLYETLKNTLTEE